MYYLGFSSKIINHIETEIKIAVSIDVSKVSPNIWEAVKLLSQGKLFPASNSLIISLQLSDCYLIISYLPRRLKSFAV